MLTTQNSHWKIPEDKFHHETCEDVVFRQLQQESIHVSTLLCAWILMPESSIFWQEQDIRKLLEKDITKDLYRDMEDTYSETDRFILLSVAVAGIRAVPIERLQALDPALVDFVKTSASRNPFQHLDLIVNSMVHERKSCDLGDGNFYSFNVPCADLNQIHTNKMLVSKRNSTAQAIVYQIVGMNVVEEFTRLFEEVANKSVLSQRVLVKTVIPLLHAHYWKDVLCPTNAQCLVVKYMTRLANPISSDAAFTTLSILSQVTMHASTNTSLQETCMERIRGTFQEEKFYPQLLGDTYTARSSSRSKLALQNGDEANNPTSLWATILVSLDTLAWYVQEGRSIDANSFGVASVFFELLGNIRQWEDASAKVQEIAHWIGYVRLRHWWQSRRIPSGEVYLAKLLKCEDVSLSVLLHADERQLSSIGITGPCVRKTILAYCLDDVESITCKETTKSTTFTIDGLYFLIRVCLFSLEALLENNEAGEVSRKFTSNSLKALGTLTSIDIAVDILTHDFGLMGHGSMSARILQSALEGLALSHCNKEAYACFTIALEICWNMTQWCLSSEVKLLDSFCGTSCPTDTDVITSIQQIWWTRIIDFVLKTLRDIREVGFLDEIANWFTQATCFALLNCILSARYFRPTCVLQEIQTALRTLIAHNLPLLEQLVNTASTLLEEGKNTMGKGTRVYPFFQTTTEEDSKLQTQYGIVEPKVSKTTVKKSLQTREELAALELVLSSLELLQAVYTCGSCDSAVLNSETTNQFPSKIVWMAISYGSFSLDRSTLPVQSIRLLRLFSASMKRSCSESERLLFNFFPSDEDRRLLSVTLSEAFNSKSKNSAALKLESIQLWSCWLELNPDFVSLVAFDPESKGLGLSFCVQSILGALPDAANWGDPLLCASLSLCRQLWKAAFLRGSKAHQHMVKLLQDAFTDDKVPSKSGSQAFWQTLFDIITCSDFTSPRSRQLLTHVYIAWALIFDMMCYEWLYSAKTGSENILSDSWKRVIDADLLCSWIRSFARFDLDITRLTDCLQHVVPFCSYSKLGNGMMKPSYVSYISQALCNEKMVAWQLGLVSGKTNNDSLIRRVTWTNSVITSSLSHHYLVRNWSQFLRLGLSQSSLAKAGKNSHPNPPASLSAQMIQVMTPQARQQGMSALLASMEEAFACSQEANFFGEAYFNHTVKLFAALLHCAESDNAASPLDSETCCRVLKLGARSMQNHSSIPQHIDISTEPTVSPSNYTYASIFQLLNEVLPESFSRRTTFGTETRISAMTACLYVLQNFYVESPEDFLIIMSQNVIVKLIESCLGGLASQDHISSECAQMSWALLYQLLHQVAVSTSTLSPNRSAVRLAPILAALNHQHQGTSAIFQMIFEQYDVDEGEVSKEKQQQTLRILEGMVALIWNQTNPHIIRQIFFKSFNLLLWLASDFVPLLLQKAKSNEDEAPRGFVRNNGTYERLMSHKAWCFVLEIVAGLVHVLPTKHLSEEGSIWLLLRCSDTFIASALDPVKKATSARIQEQQATLRLLREMVRCQALAKEWRHQLPAGYMLLLERCRQTLRRTCVLVAQDDGFCSMDASRHNEASKKKLRLWPISSLKMPSKQSPLHQQVDPVLSHEKNDSIQFYRQIRVQLYESVHLTASVLSHCIPSPQDTWIVVNGRKVLDQELLTPILSNLSPSQAAHTESEPSIGHLCLAITSAIHQLQEMKAQSTDNAVMYREAKVIVGSIQACSLLFLQALTLQLQVSDQECDAYLECRVIFEHLVSHEGLSSLLIELDVSVAKKILNLLPSK